MKIPEMKFKIYTTNVRSCGGIKEYDSDVWENEESWYRIEKEGFCKGVLETPWNASVDGARMEMIFNRSRVSV